MKTSIQITLSVLATAFILNAPVCHAVTTAQQREQAAINDNNTINNLSGQSDNTQNYTYSDDNNNENQSNDDADNGDSNSNSDDGND